MLPSPGLDGHPTDRRPQPPVPALPIFRSPFPNLLVSSVCTAEHSLRKNRDCAHMRARSFLWEVVSICNSVSSCAQRRP